MSSAHIKRFFEYLVPKNENRSLFSRKMSYALLVLKYYIFLEYFLFKIYIWALKVKYKNNCRFVLLFGQLSAIRIRYAFNEGNRQLLRDGLPGWTQDGYSVSIREYENRSLDKYYTF